MEINGWKIPTKIFVTGLGKKRIILGFPWLTKENPDTNWKTGEFSWREKERQFFFNDKNLNPLELAKRLSKQVTQTKPKRTILQKETQLRTTSTEDKDEEEHLNSTQNPLEDTELSVLISTITGDMDNGIWINSKSTTAMAIQSEINREKEVLPLEKQIPKEFHKYLDVFSE